MNHSPWCETEFYAVLFWSLQYGKWGFYAEPGMPCFDTYDEADQFAKAGGFLAKGKYEIRRYIHSCRCDGPPEADE